MIFGYEVFQSHKSAGAYGRGVVGDADAVSVGHILAVVELDAGGEAAHAQCEHCGHVTRSPPITARQLVT